MTWPAPQAGMLIRYSYLWSGEAQLGKEEGVKDRPCAVVIVTKGEGHELHVRVLPVTHRPPTMPDEAVEIPAATKNRLRLDDAPSWIILTEMNDFLWPGPDVRPVGRSGSPGLWFPSRQFLSACAAETFPVSPADH